MQFGSNINLKKIQNGGQNGEHWEPWADWLVKMAWPFWD